LAYEKLIDELKSAYTEGQEMLLTYQWLDNILQFLSKWDPVEFDKQVWQAVSDIEVCSKISLTKNLFFLKLFGCKF